MLEHFVPAYLAAQAAEETARAEAAVPKQPPGAPAAGAKVATDPERDASCTQSEQAAPPSSSGDDVARGEHCGMAEWAEVDTRIRRLFRTQHLPDGAAPEGVRVEALLKAMEQHKSSLAHCALWAKEVGGLNQVDVVCGVMSPP